MKENCGEIRDLLDLYVTGGLSAEKQSTVKEHLRECADCRRELALSKALQYVTVLAEREGEGYHLAAETLSRLVFAPELLDESARKAALEHLACCTRCTQDYETLRSVMGDAGCAEGSVERDSVWARFRYIAVRLKMAKVPAWVAVVCVIIAFFVVVREEFFVRDLVDWNGEFVVSGGVVFDPAPDLTPTRPMQHRDGRGEKIFQEVPITEVTIESIDKPTAIVIRHLDLPPGGQSADIDLYSLAGDFPYSVASWHGVRLSDDHGSIPLPVPSGILQEGLFLLVVNPTPAPPGTDQPAGIYRVQVHVEPPSRVSR